MLAKLMRKLREISWQLMGLLSFIVIVCGILRLLGMISEQNFINIILIILGMVGGYGIKHKESLGKD